MVSLFCNSNQAYPRKLSQSEDGLSFEWWRVWRTWMSDGHRCPSHCLYTGSCTLSMSLWFANHLEVFAQHLDIFANWLYSIDNNMPVYATKPFHCHILFDACASHTSYPLYVWHQHAIAKAEFYRKLSSLFDSWDFLVRLTLRGRQFFSRQRSLYISPEATIEIFLNKGWNKIMKNYDCEKNQVVFLKSKIKLN